MLVRWLANAGLALFLNGSGLVKGGINAMLRAR